MSFTGGAGTLDVGNLRAIYTIDTAASEGTIRDIVQQAANIRNQFGNVKFVLDGAQAIDTTKQLAQAAIDAKAAYTQAQTALAAYRQTQTDTAASMGALRIETQQETLAQKELATQTAALRLEMLQKKAAIDTTRPSMQGLGKDAQDLGSNLKDTTLSIAGFTAGILGVTAVVAGAHAAFTDVLGGAMAWEQQQAQIQANTTMTTQDIAAMNAEVQKLTTTTPEGMTQVANAFKYAFDYMGNTTDATKVLEAATKSAVATGSDEVATVQLLSKVMHDFKIPADDATTAMNQLHIAAQQSAVDLPQWVAEATPAIAQAATMGVTFTDTVAAMTAFVQQGYDVSTSATMLQGILRGIAEPSSTAQKAIAALSQSSGVDLVDDFTAAGLASKGLTGVLQDVQKATQGNTQELLAIMPNLRGARGEILLLGSGYQDWNTALQAQASILSGQVDPTTQGFNNTLNTTASQVEVAKNQIHLMAVELGEALLPVVKDVLNWIIQLGQAIGQVFNIPALANMKTNLADLQGTTDTATNSMTQMGQSGQTANDQITSAGKTAAATMGDLSQQAKDAQSNLDSLKGTADDLTTAMNKTNEAMKATQDYYKNLTDPIQARITAIDTLTPAEISRKAQELQQNAQLAQLQTQKPDISNYQDVIAALEQDKSNLAAPDLSGYDTQIQQLQDAISGLNTNELDQKIAAVRDALSQPAPDTSSLTNAMNVLNLQLAGGVVSQSAFDARYASLSLQKQNINDAYRNSQGANKQQLSALEQQKRDADAANAITRAKYEEQLKGVERARTAAENAHKEELANYDKEIAQLKLKEQAMLAPWQAQVDKIKQAMDGEKALDDLATANRDVEKFPLQNQLAQYKTDLTNALAPLQQVKDYYQGLIDKNNEDTKAWELKKQKIDEAISAAKKPGVATGGGGSAPAGGAFGGSALSVGKGLAPLLAMQNPTLALADNPYGPAYGTNPSDNPMVASLQQIKDKLDELGRWFDSHKGQMKDWITGLFDGVPAAITGAVQAVTNWADLIGAFTTLMSDFKANNWGNIPADLAAVSDATDKLSGGGRYADWQNGLPPGVADNGSADVRTNIPAGPPLPPGYQNSSSSASLAPITQNEVNASFGQPTGFMQGVADTIQHVWDVISGGSKVAASDIQSFDDNVSPILGPDGRLAGYYTADGQFIQSTWGDGGIYATTLTTARQNTANTFGDGGTAQASLTQFGVASGGIFGATGSVATDLGITTTGILQGFATTIQQQLGPTGAGQSLATFDTTGQGIFGDKGTFNSALANPATLAVTTFATQLGQTGLLAALAGVKTWVDQQWPALTDSLAKPFTDAWTNISTFFTNLGSGINWLAQHFKLPSIPAFNVAGQATSGGSAGGSSGGGGAGFANGVIDNPAGHMAWVGERGPEIMFVPQHATIIPNHLLGAIPGHADGFNLGILDDAVKAVGGAITGAGTKLVNTLMSGLGVPDTSGVLPGLGQALVNQVTQGLLSWLRPADVAGRAVGGGKGFIDMTLDAFMGYMQAYGGPVDTQGAYDDLISVGREHNIDPRWFMAVMQTESGYGNAAGNLAPFWNFIGMEINNRGFSFDSGVAALDSGTDFAGYADLHDMLEDLAGWIDANGTNFAPYDGSGTAKAQAYRDILAATAPAGAVSGDLTASGNIGNIEGMPGDQLIAIAQSDLAGSFGWCEQYVGDVMALAGLRYSRAGSAQAHAGLQSLAGGYGPMGAIVFFPDASGLGHVAFSMGDNGTIWGTRAGGTDRSEVGLVDASTWNPYGWTDNPALNGGVISEPVVGIGLRSGQSYSFAEDGLPELVIPNKDLAGGKLAPNVTGGGGATFAQGAIVVYAAPGMSEEQVAAITVEKINDLFVGGARGRGVTG